MQVELHCNTTQSLHHAEYIITDRYV